MSDEQTIPRGAFVRWIVIVLGVACAWRLMILLAMPAISRDGVVFCWYAQALGAEGLSYLRDPAAQQHPLYPLLILLVQRFAMLFGAVADGPLAWQLSGQFIAGLAGVAVVGLVGGLTHELIRRLALPVPVQPATLVSMLLAALLPLNIRLSIDVMSDGVHLAFYLGTILLLLRSKTAFAHLLAGMCAGAAFLTRQEAVVLVVAGTLAAWFGVSRWTRRQRMARSGTMLIGFLLLAVPYWSLIGGLSQKKDPLDWVFDRYGETAIRFELPGGGSTVDAPAVPTGLPNCLPGSAYPLAKLRLLDVSWYGVVPYALYVLFRAGRVVVPLLALLPMLNLRRRGRERSLLIILLCIGGHCALTVLLLYKYRYLSVRHMLVPVVLLMPFAALLLTRFRQLAIERGRPGLGNLIVAALLVPLAWYGLRVPNAEDGYLRRAADWLRAHDPHVAEKRLITGSSGKRIAFYANMEWTPWYEDPTDVGALVGLVQQAGPGYLAIEVGTGHERAGNDALVETLSTNEAFRRHVKSRTPLPGPNAQNTLYMYEIVAER